MYKMGALKIILNAVFVLSLFGAVLLTAFFIYGSLNPEHQTFDINDYNPFEGKKEINASGELRQFAPGLRFNHNDISYYIDSGCSDEKKVGFENALFLISDKTGIISFYEISDKLGADIIIGCSRESYQEEKGVFIAGEGGPTEYLNLKFYPIIKKGKVLLYDEKKCEYPVTELHELFHVFGFDHINDPTLIMYPYVDCDQKITMDLIEELIKLYSIKPAAELYFGNISASKTGPYLSFEVSISNEGMIDARSVVLEVYTENKRIDASSFGDIEFGTGKSFYIKNLKLPSENIQAVTFKIVSTTEELIATNNMIELKV